MESGFKANFEKLNAFVAQFSDGHVVKIGILGDKVTREGEEAEGEPITNSEIGLISEFGSLSRNIPARSWLLMPLNTKQEQILEKAAIGADELLGEGRVVQVMDNLGAAAHEWIQKSFSSAGFGTWAPLTSREGKPLVDTGAFRRSVSWEVVEKKEVEA